jgi:ABC-type polysaccharide/polyol phosphate export permease
MIDKIKELWRFRELLYNLVRRDLKVRYKNSILGVVWSWLNPLLMMLIFTFVFGVLWPREEMENYHIFFLSALLPWNFFSAAVLGGIPSIVGNGHLIKKVYFPRAILPISVVISNAVNFLISLPVFFVLAIVSGHRITLWSLLVLVPILVETIFAIGILLILSTLEVFYRDTHMVMGVVMQAWFYLTPVIYPISQLPETVTFLGIAFQTDVWLRRINPMASIINSYQDLLYWGRPTAFDFMARTTVTAVTVLIIGYWFFERYSGRFGEEV